MRRRRKDVAEKLAGTPDEPRLSIAPLIDVCFLLLIYFMVTTTIKPAERDVASHVPSIGAPSSAPQVAVVIEVRAQGAIVLNPGPHELFVSFDPNDRELPTLERHLSLLMIGGADLPPVMVRADGQAEHQRVVDVMNVLQNVGWTHVGFHDEPEP